MSGAPLKPNNTLMEARKSKLDRFYEQSLRIDDQTKTNNHSLLGNVRLCLDDKANEVTEDPKFDPFLQFVKRILVHLMSSSDRSWAGSAVIFGTMVLNIATLTDAGRRAWIDAHPQSRPQDSMVPYIVSYIQHSPPAIVLVDTEDYEENPCRETKGYSSGSVRKGADENNEMFFSRELVTAYIDLVEKVKAGNPLSDQLVIVQSVIMIAFLHELAHTITKSLFRRPVALDLDGQQGEVGDALEQVMFGGIMCVEWLRRDFEDRDLRMKRIQNLYIMRIEAEQSNSSKLEQPIRKSCFYKLEIEDLRVMLDSLDRIEIYSPAYVPDQNDIADRNAGCADGKSYIRLRVTPHGIKPLEAYLKSTSLSSPPSRVAGLGSDSIIVFSAKDRIIVGDDQCKR
ncbi:uncharacterized protein ARMOST_15856 [Armillaria ostoyae]|uniref:Uncharacterized protein n=1 Tax=Armillaria ostoyae TaxID=47428 RepID=A0A284RUH3_ARMOS|nr:uncharacterized protein ARMOST_15856 [Armillaria ostoyae]